MGIFGLDSCLGLRSKGREKGGWLGSSAFGRMIIVEGMCLLSQKISFEIYEPHLKGRGSEVRSSMTGAKTFGYVLTLFGKKS